MKRQGIKTENLYLAVIIGAVIAAVFLYSYFGTSSLYIFNSPDETANFFSTESFYLYNSLGRTESLNNVAPALIHPRSIVVRGDYLLPVSFWGLPVIYGAIAKISGLGFVPFITPIFSALTILFFYFLIKKIFGPETGFWSALALVFLPPFLYFSNRGLFHNILFLDLTILFLTIVVCRPVAALGRYAGRKSWLYSMGDDIWSAIALGLAFWARPTEFIWVLPILIGLIIVYRKKLNLKGTLLSAGIFLFFVFIFFLVNRNLYGAWLGSGYLLSRGKEIVEGTVGVRALAGSLLPFGIHPRLILFNLWHYFLGLFPVLGWFYVVGFLFLAFKIYLKDLTKPEKVYFAGWTFAAAVLFVYYGSGVFQDNPDAGAVTVAVSYFRYWLPVFVFGLPVALGWLLHGLKIFPAKFRRIGMAGLFVLYALVSFLIVFMTPGDGLFDVKSQIYSYRDIIARAEALVPPGALIVVDRADKIFFPQWPVALYDPGDAFYDAVAKLRAVRPVYYFRPGPTPEEQLQIRNKLGERNLSLKRLDIFGRDVLYEIR